MICKHCKKPGATKAIKPRSYFGTVSYAPLDHVMYPPLHFHPECYEKWWADLTWHLDTLDERMNANIYFHRIAGMKGIYDDGEYRHPKEVDASLNGLEARSIGIPYRFQHRRPHPDTCKGCILA